MSVGYTVSSKGSSSLTQMVCARRHRPSQERLAQTASRQPRAALCQMHREWFVAHLTHSLVMSSSSVVSVTDGCSNVVANDLCL